MAQSIGPFHAAFHANTFRKQLHKYPELSCHEVQTADAIAQQLTLFGLNPVVGVEGYGVLCVITGSEPGETTLLRADFDAIPVNEKNPVDHASIYPGVMHACGHDGHTTSLIMVAHQLSQSPPKRGTVILVFQPAEEIGTGAASMLNHPALKGLNVDNAFAYHNLPGQPLHEIVVKKGTFSCASIGLSIDLEGKTSHAAYPENGVSPLNAMIEILQYLQTLPDSYPEEFSLVTIVNAELGERAFGVAAGSAKIMATLRSDCNATFLDIQKRVQRTLQRIEQNTKLDINYSWHEPFNAAVNSSHHVDLIRQHATKLNLAVTELETPMRWSEDFAEFLLRYQGALFGIGSGVSHPELHNPDYDFPDEILETACSLYVSIIRQIHGQD
ncbi:amidohydrolase [Vibrio sp. 10N.261.51.F12]|uniref:amidohydrolase n=1 Tax=Vibrio sp. 10N.261.51.F12 TaxID=3229679 RepID=UPI003552146B